MTTSRLVRALEGSPDKTTAHYRYSTVESVTAPYSSAAPQVRLDGSPGAVRFVNYTGQTLAVSNRVIVLLQSGDGAVVGKKP